MQPKFSGWGIGKRDTRELAIEASTRIREVAFNAKALENKSKQTVLLFARRKILNG
jgi:hypothetical protein